MIIQTDLNGYYIATHKNKTTAAKTLGVDESTIRKAVKYGRKVMGKFKFYPSRELTQSEGIITTISTTHNGYRWVSPTVIMEKLQQINENKTDVDGNIIVPEAISAPKILVLDIETAPIRAYTWGLWKQNIFLDQIISNFFIISWAAKWLNEGETLGMVLTPNEIIKERDKNILIPLWELLDQADIVIAHNGDQFDIPKINSRFVVNDMLPPSPYKQIDTRKIAKNIFGFSSNKLEALARQFGFEGKYGTTMELWVDCMKGDALSLFQMLEYNEQDVIVLENVFNKIKGYAKGFPNLNLYNDEDFITCPHCNSKHVSQVQGKYFYTNSVRYQLYTCDECGAHSRGKKAVPYKNKKQIISIPR